jgi:hypothetical protein
VCRIQVLTPSPTSQNGSPETVTNDKSGPNLAALHAMIAERETPIKIRQIKYFNNVVEQDHPAIKRITRPMQGSNDLDWARIIPSGIETMHVIKNWQMKCLGKSRCSLFAVRCSLFAVRCSAVLLTNFIRYPLDIEFTHPSCNTATQLCRAPLLQTSEGQELRETCIHVALRNP